MSLINFYNEHLVKIQLTNNVEFNIILRKLQDPKNYQFGISDTLGSYVKESFFPCIFDKIIDEQKMIVQIF